MTRTLVLCDIDGCLSDGMVYVSATGEESLRFSKRDGWRLEEARTAGIEVELVTCDPSASPPPTECRIVGLSRAVGAVAHRAAKLGIRATWCWRPADKATRVREFQADGFRVVYIGDSLADLEAMRAADEAYAPHDHGLTWGRLVAGGGPPDLMQIKGEPTCVHVCAAKGGEGVLHEVLGYLLAGASDMTREWKLIWDGNRGRTADGRLSATLAPAAGCDMSDGGTLWECSWSVRATDEEAQLALVDSRSDSVEGDVMAGIARSEASAERAATFARVYAEAAAAEVYESLERTI